MAPPWANKLGEYIDHDVKRVRWIVPCEDLRPDQGDLNAGSLASNAALICAASEKSTRQHQAPCSASQPPLPPLPSAIARALPDPGSKFLHDIKLVGFLSKDEIRYAIATFPTSCSHLCNGPLLARHPGIPGMMPRVLSPGSNHSLHGGRGSSPGLTDQHNTLAARHPVRIELRS